MAQSVTDTCSAVRKLRMAMECTQQEFAHRLGLAIATVVRYEHNRPPRGKALAKLEQIAAAHGMEEYAAVFRRALGSELGAPPPAPTGLTVEAKDEEEKNLLVALLDALRKPGYAKEAKTVRRILGPVVVRRRSDAEVHEAIEVAQLSIVRLLKSGHTPEDIQTRLGTSVQNIAEAFFRRGGPKLFSGPREWESQFGGIVRLLLKDGWSIERMGEEFGDAESFRSCASDLGNHEAVREYEKSIEEDPNANE